jgi:hypothetical protein
MRSHSGCGYLQRGELLVKLASLFAACWKDEALKARFMADPKAVLAEYDMPVPDGMDVKVVENADNCVHITMPAPPTGSMELSDEELSHAAGGICDERNWFGATV